MDTQDKSFITTAIMVLGILVVFTVVVFLLARMLSTINSNKLESSEAYQQQQTAQIGERLHKIGSVETFDANAKPQVRSGQAIYETVCATCHTTGVLEAPKIGTADDWKARLTGGFDALVSSGTTGKGAMPPKGGDASLTDTEMKKVVAYMLKESGLDAPDISEGSSAEAPAKEAATDTTASQATDIEKPTEAATNNPIEAVVDTGNNLAKNVVASVAATGATAVATVTGAAHNAVDTVATKTAAAPKAAVSHAEPANLDKGKAVYKTACFACHDSGVAGAPKLGDKPAWTARLAAGADAMLQSALKGKGGMPPKGGRIDLSEEDIKASVDFMISQAQ